ncbi:hypothetical protein ACHAW5_004165 [Stephanodiscus triporus]|uniref:Uncharacterized protein n=1 Tax=Stephanodiscus triporus TaxID=2934178 RepID=A0ABD3PMB9_9STRA
MKLSVATFAAGLAVVGASSPSSKWANLRRRLSFEKIAGYEPANLRRRLSFEKIAGYEPHSQVTDHAAIDLDQAAIEEQLALHTTQSFTLAQKIYNEGGHSKSYAVLTLSSPLTSAVLKEAPVVGQTADGREVSLKSYEDYPSGADVIQAYYATTDVQESFMECQVGGLVTKNTVGCLMEDGTVDIGGTEYAYTYVMDIDNKNDRTIAKFSTKADEQQLAGCPGCPYKDFMYFYEYYGTHDYAHKWVEAAFAGIATEFANGNADFSKYTFVGREQAIKKGTAYMNIFMYVIREMEDALDDCQKGAVQDNYNHVQAWDEAVAFYTGSIEGQDGVTPDGKLLHQLADKRCADWKTCGMEGVDVEGKAKLNYDVFDLFALGSYQIISGNCLAARETKEAIVRKMYVPLMQGVMAYAYEVEKLQGGEKENAEGATFAAAVLPRVHAESPSAAKTIYDNMMVGAASTDYKAVRSAFESVYPALGISCADIGGFWNQGEHAYYPGMEPCTDASTTTSSTQTEVVTKTNKTLAVALGCTFGALFAAAAAMVLYMRSREKQGQPVFQTEAGADAKAMN